MNNEEKNVLASEVIAAASACPEFKEAAKSYLAAIGTEGEKECARLLVASAEESINTIDDTIAFLKTDMAVKIFGEELSRVKLAEAEAHKANGGRFCDCPGCVAAKKVLDEKKELC